VYFPRRSKQKVHSDPSFGLVSLTGDLRGRVFFRSHGKEFRELKKGHSSPRIDQFVFFVEISSGA